MDLSIVVPVYNSEKIVEDLIKKINSSIQEINFVNSYEIILVNDCSPDDSWKKIEILSKKFNFVKGINLKENFGQHNAIMAGLNESVGEKILTMDDDLQHSAESLLELINFSTNENNNYDVVYTHYGEMKYNFFRNVGRKFNNFIANLLLEKPKSLYLSSFKLVNRFLINEIIKYQSPYAYIDGLILGITSKIGKIKVKHSERTKGKSGYTLKKLLSVWSSMSTGFSVVPLRLSLVLGSLLSLLGFIFALLTFIERMLDNTVPSGYATIIIAVTLFSGAILIALGLIGEYVGRIFMEKFL